MAIRRKPLPPRERPIRRMKNGYPSRPNQISRRRQRLVPLLPLRKVIQCASCAISVIHAEKATHPSPFPTHHQLLYTQQSCLRVFSMMLRLLHLYMSLHSLQFLPLGLISHGRVSLARTAAAYPFASPQTMSVLSWMVHLSFTVLHALQCMVYGILYVREGGADGALRTCPSFSFLDLSCRRSALLYTGNLCTKSVYELDTCVNDVLADHGVDERGEPRDLTNTVGFCRAKSNSSSKRSISSSYPSSVPWGGHSWPVW